MKDNIAKELLTPGKINEFFQSLADPSTQKITCMKPDSDFDLSDLALFRIDEITFEEDAPRQEALENVLASLRIPGINIVYLIVGTRQGVQFYFGVSKDPAAVKTTNITVKEIGQDILKPSLSGNFRGSLVSDVDNDQLDRIVDRIRRHSCAAVLEGVPGISKDQEKKNFQGVDRVVDVMLGDEFVIMLLAKPITERNDNYSIEKELYEIYSLLAPFSKSSYQRSQNKGTSVTSGTNEGDSTTSGKSKTTTEGTSSGTSASKSTSVNSSVSQNKSTSVNVTMGQSKTTSTNYSLSESENVSNGTNYSKGTNTGTNWSTGTNTSKQTSSNGSHSSTSESGGSSSSKGGSNGTSETSGTSSSRSKGSSKSKGSSESTGTNESKGSSESAGTSESSGTSESVTTSSNKGKNRSVSAGENESISHNTGSQQSVSENIGSGLTSSTELINKEAQEWMKYFDDVLFPRLDYGSGKGLFVVSTCLFAENPKVLLKLGNTMKSIFSGECGNRVPLSIGFDPPKSMIDSFRTFQQPLANDAKNITELSRHAQIARSHCILPALYNDKRNERMFLGNWMSSGELGVLAGIPKKEIVGMKLKEEVEFGLNLSDYSPDDKSQGMINLGKLVQSGQVSDIPVEFPVADLDRHIFVSGVTGSGKTNTCEKILIGSNLPFLVIEPAKTEYRSMKNDIFPDLLVFTLGTDSVAPFRLNPFEILPGENITSRVDMIKANIEAAFEMEAAIPQIIEAAIYESYEAHGWDIQSNENTLYKDPFADGVFAFPTLEEMIAQTEKVVIKQGFDDRLKKDYIGSIKARLQGLTVGAKGLMLNCRRSLDFEKILDRKVVLELEEIRSGSEKSLMMGFVLINLLESIKRRYRDNKNKKHYHITLIEEAHRLLSRCEPGDSPNKKHGVETFADMLAEIRKYGESLIIADQIPNKLTPEVLKNTNTKIVHRLFAQDDKDAIGSTMSLTDEQRDFLSNLKIGRAIMFTGAWDKAVQVTVDKLESKDDPIDSAILRKAALELYAQNYKRGIIEFSEVYDSELFKRQPTVSEMEELLTLENDCYKAFKIMVSKSTVKADEIMCLVQTVDFFGKERILDRLIKRRYQDQAEAKKDFVYHIFDCLKNGKIPDPNDFATLK